MVTLSVFPNAVRDQEVYEAYIFGPLLGQRQRIREYQVETVLRMNSFSLDAETLHQAPAFVSYTDSSHPHHSLGNTGLAKGRFGFSVRCSVCP